MASNPSVSIGFAGIAVMEGAAIEASVKVSIVVPFYNIEQCVVYCMESLLGQTYESYEIICVDDGSTDSTGRLLDGYADLTNVYVYHKANGGLSDARNFGIRVAKGDYLTFVDGDDVISPFYLEHMIDALALCPEAMIVGSYVRVPDSAVLNGTLTWNESAGSCSVLSQSECIDYFLVNIITESAWGKLVPRRTYTDSFFPVGRVYEDLATFPVLISQFERVVFLKGEDYGYVFREGSIARSKDTRIRQAEDYLAALEALNKLPVDGERLAYRRALATMRLRPILKAVSDDPEEAKALMKSGQKELRRDLAQSLKSPGLSAVNKVRLCVYAVSPSLHDAVLRLFQRTSEVRA